MPRKTTHILFVLTLAPLVAVAALRPGLETPVSFSGVRQAIEPRLELATLKAEARSLIVHVDGP
jgi:hypothetical protein